MSITEPSTAQLEIPEVASANAPSNNQQLFLRYFTAILIDLVVLSLFAEYWSLVTIDSFTMALFAAVLLQLLLKLTLHLEHKVAAVFQGKPGAMAKFLRVFCAWLILFSSKFVILFAIDFVLGDAVIFAGPLHGVVVFLAVVVAILASEELVVRSTAAWPRRNTHAARPSPSARASSSCRIVRPASRKCAPAQK